MSSSPNPLPPFAPTPEFDLIGTLLRAGGGGWEEGELGPGDDCALWSGQLISKDLSVEGVHYRLDWSTPQQAIEKAIRSNLSDINAMGGKAQAVLLGVCLAHDWSSEQGHHFMRALGNSCRQNQLRILGGDTVRGPLSFISVTIFGSPGPRILRRQDARPGHKIYVSGPLGAAAAGLEALQRGWEADFPDVVALHRIPEPPLALGPLLAGVPGVGAAIDLSDGLSSELHHLAAASGVSLRVHTLPHHHGVEALARRAGRPPAEYALHGGEDYQLLFTSAEPILILEAADAHPFRPICIGEVGEGQGVFLQMLQGNWVPLQPGAYAHFVDKDPRTP